MRIYRFDGAFTTPEGETHPLQWYASYVPSHEDVKMAAHPLVCIKLEATPIEVDEGGDEGIARLSISLYPPTERGGEIVEVAGAIVDPVAARMNELEHSQRNTERKLDRLLDMMAKLSPPQAPPQQSPPPPADAPQRMIEREGRRRATAEMNSDPDPKSGSMGLVGAAPTSTILRPGIGQDGKPTMIPQPMSIVGDSLRKMFNRR